jgi:hypothetical protein
MNLDIESYIEHLDVLWHPVDYYEVGVGIDRKLVYWVKMDFAQIPKEVLTTTEIYSAFRDWKWVLTIPLKT